MPDRRLALGLMPTDSTMVPNAVFRVNSATAATTMADITMGIGQAEQAALTNEPEGRVQRGKLLAVGQNLSHAPAATTESGWR